MFSISPAASAPIPAHVQPAAAARALPTSAAVTRHDVTALRDEVVTALRNGSAVDRNVLLSLLPAMQSWPGDLPIDLVTEGALSGQRFGPQLGYTDGDGPVYVKLCATGRYAISCSLDSPPHQWWDCGAVTSPDSLFHAVLGGMQLRDATRHARFTLALQQAHAGYWTDGQRLRERLADELVAAHPQIVCVLEDLAGLRGRTSIDSMPLRQPLRGSDTVDAALLQRLARMTADELLEAAGLLGLHDHHSVFYASLRASAGMRTAGTSATRASGLTGSTREIDRSLLLDILKETWATDARDFDELARDYEVDYRRLHDLVLARFIPTARGLDMIRRKTNRFLMTPDVVQVVKGMHEESRLPSLHHFFAVVHLCNLSFEALYQHIHTSGLTKMGRDFLSPDRTTTSNATARKRKARVDSGSDMLSVTREQWGNVSGDKSARLVDASLSPIVLSQFAAPPAPMLGSTSGPQATTMRWTNDPDPPDSGSHADADLLDARLDPRDASPGQATWADPGLPDDLMSLAVEDLMSPMPGLFPRHSTP